VPKGGFLSAGYSNFIAKYGFSGWAVGMRDDIGAKSRFLAKLSTVGH
jgi:hypothetical protein